MADGAIYFTPPPGFLIRSVTLWKIRSKAVTADSLCDRLTGPGCAVTGPVTTGEEARSVIDAAPPVKGGGPHTPLPTVRMPRDI